MTDELVKCGRGGGTGCAPSARARAALQAAKDAETVWIVEQKCEANDGPACMAVVRAAKDQSDAAHWLKRACELGEPFACRLFAQAMSASVSRDDSEIQRATQRGFEHSMCRDAIDKSACAAQAQYLSGADGRRSADRAAKLQGECEAGKPRSCLILSLDYASGNAPTPKDATKAAEYREKAKSAYRAEWNRGVGSSCDELAALLSRPSLGTPDH